VIVGNGTVGVAVELRKLVHILPHCLAAGVEDVGPIAVDLYTLHFLGVNTFNKMWGVVPPAEAKAKIEEQKREAGITDPKNLEAPFFASWANTAP